VAESVLNFVLMGSDMGASAAMKKVGLAAGEASAASQSGAAKSSAAWAKFTKVAGIALIAFAVESVKMAAEFDKQMELVHTQAGASQQEVDSLKQGVLNLAGATGQGPAKLAEALYHVESVGYRGADALGILKMAAEEATISGANLDDTTYALTSTMKTFGDTGVRGATKDISLLNAIVGQGDMRFQDLNLAIQTGILSTGQTFGVSLQSMGAALDYLTDRGEKADVSSTRLSMGIVLMAAPSKQATKYLTDLHLAGQDVTTAQTAMQQALSASGLTTTKLASDLRKPDGIYVALKDLTDQMHKGGLSANQSGALIAKIFGGARTGKAVMALAENIDGVRQKFDAVGKQAGQFGEAWNATTKTMSFRWHAFTSGLQASMVEFGHTLMPAVSVGMSGFELLGRGIAATGRAIADNLPLVAALGVAYAAINFERIAGRMSDLVLLFEPLRMGALKAADALRTLGGGSMLLGTAGVAALVLSLAGAIRTFADVGNSAASVNKQFTEMTQGMNTGNIDALNKKMAALAPASRSIGSGWQQVGGVLNQLTGGIFGKTILQMGNTTVAAHSAEIALANQKLAVTSLAGEFGISTDRVSQFANEVGINLADGTVTSTQKFEEMYSSLGTLPPQFEAVQSATSDTAKATQDYNNAITNSINLAGGQQGALLQFNSDLMHLKDNLAGASRDLSDNTDEGIKNQQAILKVAGDFSTYMSDLQKSSVPLAQQQLLTAGLTKKFEDQMVQLGWTKQKVDDYLTSIGMTPPTAVTVFSAPGLPDVITGVDMLGISLANIHDKTVTLAINAILNDQGVASSAAQMMLGIGVTTKQLPNGQTATYNSSGTNPLLAGIPTNIGHRARGGLLRGPGTGTSDSIPLWGSAGEFMMNAKATSANLPALAAMNSGGTATTGVGVNITINALDSKSVQQWLTTGGAKQIAIEVRKATGNGLRLN
jgi:TP901 family phage tail tape measure protein